MGFLDKLLGRDETPPAYDAPARSQSPRAQSPDEQAVARYLYLLKTAPPEDIERAHEEAFARLTPEQRRQVLEQLGQVVPDSERSGLNEDPRSLARAATRAEMQRPGALQQAFGGGMGGGMGMGGMGMGGMMMGGLFTSLAGAFIGTSIAHAFFSNPANEFAYQQSPEAADSGGESGADTGTEGSADGNADSGDAGTDGTADGDFGGGDFGGGDLGGDFGSDLGGDFGGDFGGGDF